MRFRLLREVSPDVSPAFHRLFQRQQAPDFLLREDKSALLRPFSNFFHYDVTRRRRRAVRQLDANVNPVAGFRRVVARIAVFFFVVDPAVTVVAFVPTSAQLPQRRRRFAAKRVAQLERQIAKRLLERVGRRFVGVGLHLLRRDGDQRPLLGFRQLVRARRFFERPEKRFSIPLAKRSRR